MFRNKSVGILEADEHSLRVVCHRMQKRHRGRVVVEPTFAYRGV